MMLDPTDWAILHELQQDARLSYAELGRRVGLSSPAVQERVRKLEDAGIIEGYHAKINVELVGYPIVAFIRVGNVNKLEERILEKKARMMDEVLEYYHITGEDCYLIKVVAKSVSHLNQVVQHYHTNTTTSVIVAAYHKNQTPIPDEAINNGGTS